MYEKLKTMLVHLLSIAWAFVTPVHGLVFAVGALVLLDFITGISKAIKTGGLKAIQSRRMRETVGKGLLYMIAVLAGFFLDYITELGMAARAVAGVIALVETKSVLENVEAMTGVNVLQALLEKLKPPPVVQGLIEQAKPADSKSDPA